LKQLINLLPTPITISNQSIRPHPTQANEMFD